MAKKKYTRAQELVAQTIFRKLAETHNAPDEPKGIVDFYYTDFAATSEGRFQHLPDISNLINGLESDGKIHRIHRGTAGRPSRWDVTNFIATDMRQPQVEVTVTKDKPRQAAPAPVDQETPKIPKKVPTEVPPVAEEKVTADAEVTLSEVSGAINQMITYMRDSQQEMTKHLQGMLEKLTAGDVEKAKELQEELARVTGERDRARFELQQAMEQAKPEVPISKHIVYRFRNRILDEVERFIDTPNWQKGSRIEHFRKEVVEDLNKIMEEVGVGAGGE